MLIFHPTPTDPRFQNLSQRLFGKWTVLGLARKSQKGHCYLWHCQCKCGTVKEVAGNSLLANTSRACSNCAQAEANTTHGHSRSNKGRSTPTYSTWQSMIRRCCLTSDPKYYMYGAVGISVCDRWRHSFENFLADMGERPTGKTIDRFPDKKGSYKPGNCRWATPKEQQRNTKSNRLITWRGRTQSLAAWAEELGMGYKTLQCRLDNYGWPVEKAILTPVAFRRPRR